MPGKTKSKIISLLKTFAGALVYILFCFSVLVLIAFGVSLLRGLCGSPPPDIKTPGPFRHTVLSVLFYAYIEEAVFRVYLIKMLAACFRFTPAGASAFSVLFFALFHSWEGFWGIMNSFFAAAFLTFMYLRTKNIHIVALAHYFYNMFCLIA